MPTMTSVARSAKTGMVSMSVPSRSHRSTLGRANADTVRVLLGGKIRLVSRVVAIDSIAGEKS